MLVVVSTCTNALNASRCFQAREGGREGERVEKEGREGGRKREKKAVCTSTGTLRYGV